MYDKKIHFGRWAATIIPDDGARIASLEYDGISLLTGRPEKFQAPAKNFGKYETRPVYGYDDCFPTVDECDFPVGEKPHLPDHGELCWRKWNVSHSDNSLICSIESDILPVKFTRRLIFGDTSLGWQFEVDNRSTQTIPFIHVMHALLPLNNVTSIELPKFSQLYDEMNSSPLAMSDPGSVTKLLLDESANSARMLLLRDISAGNVGIGLAGGMNINIKFSPEMFPTLGIWLNNSAYPDEPGLARNECAFEPIPGSSSSLADSYNDGLCFKLPPEQKMTWNIDWIINI